MIEKNVYLISIIVISSILFYFLLGIKVAYSRNKYKIFAPKTSGNEKFDRISRSHQNTLEYFFMFIPLFAISSIIFDSFISFIVGIFGLLTRFLYVFSYIKNPPSRLIYFKLNNFVLILFLLFSTYSIIKYFIF